MKNFLTTPYVNIKGDPERKVVALQWTGYCPSKEYRLALETARQVVEENGIRFWLADLREMEAIMRDDELWTIENWFPRMGKAGLERMAILMSSDAFNAMSVDRIMSDSEPSYGFQVAYFDKREKAFQWLTEKNTSAEPVGK